MIERSQVIFIAVILLMVAVLIFSGCVQVTPPSGEKNASAYGPTSHGGSIKDMGNNQSNENRDESAKGNTNEKTTGSGSENNTGAVNNTVSKSFVQVTPRDYSELQSEKSSSYISYGMHTSSNDEKLLTIYEFNQSFLNNATAYTYDLINPPLYVILNFTPKMVEDTIEVYKRTGDKEGTVTYKKSIPSRDSWFEMRVYNLDTGEEIAKDGFGRTYDITNKTTIIRTNGRLEFDFMGDQMSANISMKIPVNSSVIKEYSEINALLEQKKEGYKLLPSVFITEKDLPEGWQTREGSTHTETQYRSMLLSSLKGSSIDQDILLYADPDKAIEGYDQTKQKNSGENMVTILNGDAGYGFESVRKTGVVFRQGNYVVQLTSFSYPPVSIVDLKGYSSVISNRIIQN